MVRFNEESTYSYGVIYLDYYFKIQRIGLLLIISPFIELDFY